MKNNLLKESQVYNSKDVFCGTKIKQRNTNSKSVLTKSETYCVNQTKYINMNLPRNSQNILQFTTITWKI